MGNKKQKRKVQHSNKNKAFVAAGIIGAVPLLVFLYWYLSLRVPKLPQPPLKDLASTHNINLGIHVRLDRLDNPVYPNLVTSQFSFVTIDGEAHWDELRPTSTTYSFTKSDKLVQFAQTNGMGLQFHHLVWGEETRLPGWLNNSSMSKDNLMNLLHDHITTVVDRYKGEVAEWSVVNEAFTRAQHYYGLKDWWADHLGETSYIDNSFKWAHEADPRAKLILNDFANETENSVSNAMFNYIKSAKARGVPIDGLGMQMHINATSPPTKTEVIKNMQRFAAIGVPTYVTEFDVNLNQLEGTNLRKRQVEAQITADMVRACIESKACVSFSEFDISDKNDRLKQIMGTDAHSFLFDSRFRPKPSYYAFRDAWIQP